MKSTHFCDEAFLIKAGSLLHKYIKYTFLCLYSPIFSVLKHRELFLSLYKREFKTKTAGTALGIFWLFGQQALQVIALWFLIDVILQVRFPGTTPFLNYFLVGMIPWLVISEILLNSTSLFQVYSQFFKKTVFPLELLPILNIVFSLSIFLVIYLFVVFILNGWLSMLLSIVVFFFLFVWLLPLVYLFSTLGIFIKDFAKIMPFVLTMMMYLSPILYMPVLIPEEYQFYLIFNPIADVMAFIHAIINYHQWPEIGTSIRLFVEWFILLGPSWLLFKRAEKHIRDIV